MKEKIIYAGSFLLAFIFVSSAIIYVNTLFMNIFKFDFRPASQGIAQVQPAKQQTSNQLNANQVQKIDSTKLKAQTADSLKADSEPVKLDSASTIVLKDTNSVKKVQNIVSTQKAINELTANNSADSTGPSKEDTAKKDSLYQYWIKKTSKLYESMDAKKAAKIILDYSDNIARDLLLTMRKKKAAEILGEIKPDVAARIISLN